jgi:hypothetical protein
MRCQAITHPTRFAVGVKSTGGRQCSRHASYFDTAQKRYFCKQHAKVQASVLFKAKNRIRPECFHCNDEGKLLLGAPEPALLAKHTGEQS